jgi:hypothetical protein
VLGLGLTEAVLGFPALPSVAAELETLQHLYHAEVLLNQRFLLPRVEKELQEKPFSIVHIGILTVALSQTQASREQCSTPCGINGILTAWVLTCWFTKTCGWSCEILNALQH